MSRMWYQKDLKTITILHFLKAKDGKCKTKVSTLTKETLKKEKEKKRKIENDITEVVKKIPIYKMPFFKEVIFITMALTAVIVLLIVALILYLYRRAVNTYKTVKTGAQAGADALNKGASKIKSAADFIKNRKRENQDNPTGTS